ncbi:MAG: hypothetical protein IPM02_13365 [Betaproteobacteria bacterium]|nr:hypothetical protein [Betaproteobacteria bacterium]
MFQQIAVGVIVALAALYATWKLLPRGLRVRLAQAVAGRARRGGWLDPGAAATLARRLAAGGCGSCDSCGTCAPESLAAQDATVVRFTQGATGARSART